MDCAGVQGRTEKQIKTKKVSYKPGLLGKEWSRRGLLVFWSSALDQQEVLDVAAGHTDMFLQCSGRTTVQRPM